MFRTSVSSLLACTVTLACTDPTAGAAPTTPVISLTLVEGESLQIATVFLATPGDSAIPAQGLPVGAADAALQIEDTSGTVWPLSSSGVLGEFTVALSPRRDALYTLRGTVLGRSINALTRVPADFTLLRPAADTISTADVTACAIPAFPGMVCVAVEVGGDSTLTVDYRMTDRAGPYAEAGAAGPGTSELRLFTAARVREIIFVGLSADAAAWLSSSNPRSNITGGFGGFGSALIVRRSVLLP